MNYYELIYLKHELKNKLKGAYIEQAVSPFKNFVEFFVINSESKHRLQFSVSPGLIALFTDSYRGAKKSNTIDFFSDIYGLEIENIEIPESDRWLTIQFVNGQKLCFRLFSNHANVFLSEDDIITETFKDYDKPGSKIPEPKLLNLFEADISGKNVKNKIISLNPMFPREHIQDLISIHNLDEKEDAELTNLIKEIDFQLREKAEFRLLQNGDATLISEKYLPLKTEKLFDSVNELIAYRYKNHSANSRLKQKKSTLVASLNKQIKKQRALLSNLENAERGLKRAEEYEQFGHLLMANAHFQSGNEKSIKVKNLYEEGKEVEIPLLKEDSDIAENAQHYYKKAQNARRSFDEAKKKIPETEKQLDKLLKLQSEVESIEGLWQFQDWEKENRNRILPFINSSGNKDQQQQPFHILEENGYAIWIGKNAKSNDKLVQSAHKEDVWMHARGVAGSHLVIRMGNDKNMPGKETLLKAASYAAYNSKARGSDLVPVIITKLKYVRKPKGALPGAVIVEKEEVEMVTPQKPDL